MGTIEDQLIAQISQQMTRMQAGLDDRRAGGGLSFANGLLLGLFAGALAAFSWLKMRESEPAPAAATLTDSIVLNDHRRADQPEGRPRPIAPLYTAPPGTAPQPGTPVAGPAASLVTAGPANTPPTAAATPTVVVPTAGAAATMQIAPDGDRCPASHPVKGNNGSMGALIYHLPGTASYERTKPEICFASEAAAQAAGYRAPRG